MFDLFLAAPRDLRKTTLREYRQYLIERDGEINVQERTLSKREEAMKRFETPPAVPRSIDEARFRLNYASYDERSELSEEMLLLLALVKTNAAEAYGVSRSFNKAMQQALASEDDLELRILCEETYHTRILLSAAKCYGFEVAQPYHPPSALRILIGGIATTPPFLSRPLVLAGEILGTLLFMKLQSLRRGSPRPYTHD